MNATEHLGLEVNIGPGNGLVQSRNKLLPEPMLTKIYVTILYGFTKSQWKFFNTSQVKHYWLNINSLTPPSTAYMRHLFGAKPLSKPMLGFVNWTLRNKLQWNSDWNTKIFIHENALENIFCKLVTILSRRRRVNEEEMFKISSLNWVYKYIYIITFINYSHMPHDLILV